MRKGWKRVAESADNQAFGTDEIRDAILPALEEDCRAKSARSSLPTSEEFAQIKRLPFSKTM